MEYTLMYVFVGPYFHRFPFIPLAYFIMKMNPGLYKVWWSSLVKLASDNWSVTYSFLGTTNQTNLSIL